MSALYLLTPGSLFCEISPLPATIVLENSLDADHACQRVRPDLDPN